MAAREPKRPFGQKVYLVLAPDGLSLAGVRVHEVKLTRKAALEVAETIPGATTQLHVATK